MVVVMCWEVSLMAVLDSTEFEPVLEDSEGANAVIPPASDDDGIPGAVVIETEVEKGGTEMFADALEVGGGPYGSGW